MAIEYKGIVYEEDGRIMVSIKPINNPSEDLPDFRGAWSLGWNTKARRELAYRLINAINAGVAIKNVRCEYDINQVEYLTGDFQLSMRHLNADLKKRGF